MNLVEQYWAGVQRRLQAEVDGFNSLINHQGEKGRENELSLARVLASLIPSRYGVGSGLIFDSQGNESSQTDIILFDAVDEPAVLAQTNQVLFPIENVRGAIEVKTSVGKAEIEDIGEKVGRARSLDSRTDSTLIYAAVGYLATQQVHTIAKHIGALKEGVVDNRPDLLLVLDPGLVGISAEIARDLGWQVPDEVDYLLGVTPLQRRRDGQRLVGEYEDAPEGDAINTIYGGNLYKIHIAPEHGDYLAESARALLLFSEALLTTLALRGNRPAPGFHHYITPEMRDLLLLF